MQKQENALQVRFLRRLRGSLYPGSRPVFAGWRKKDRIPTVPGLFSAFTANIDMGAILHLKNRKLFVDACNKGEMNQIAFLASDRYGAGVLAASEQQPGEISDWHRKSVDIDIFPVFRYSTYS